MLSPDLRSPRHKLSAVGQGQEKRQRTVLKQPVQAAGFETRGAPLNGCSREASSDDIDNRPGFVAMLQRIASNGIGVILVETASRFARDLVVQETAHKKLRQLGIELIAADSPDTFVHDTPTAVMVRQILGAVAQFEKAALVTKLKGARARKRAETGKCEGRKSHAKTRPEAVALAKQLRRVSFNSGKRLSYAKIAEQLEQAGKFE